VHRARWCTAGPDVRGSGMLPATGVDPQRLMMLGARMLPARSSRPSAPAATYAGWTAAAHGSTPAWRCAPSARWWEAREMWHCTPAPYWTRTRPKGARGRPIDRALARCATFFHGSCSGEPRAAWASAGSSGTPSARSHGRDGLVRRARVRVKLRRDLSACWSWSARTSTTRGHTSLLPRPGSSEQTRASASPW
jgi:hypothetical protein